MSKQRINPWSWHGLPWSGLRPRDKANENRTTLYAFLWIASIAAIRIPLVAGMPEWTAWPFVALSLGCGWLLARAFHRMLREADELMRIVQLEALAAGFGAGLICGMIAACLTIPPAPWVFMAFIVPMVTAYGTRMILAARQAVKDEQQ
jgi:predicted ABC-type sugar transport system permease subunit